MTTAANELAVLLVLLSGVLVFFAWWSWRLRSGIRIRPWLIGLFGVFYFLAFLLVETEVLHLPWGRVAGGAAFLDLLSLVVASIPAYHYTARTTVFEPVPSGEWIYRGRLVIPAVWLAFFLLRYGVELALLGRIYLFTPVPSHAASVPSFAGALILVDALFAASTGIVLGDSLAIYRAYRRERRRGPIPSGATSSGTPEALATPPGSS